MTLSEILAARCDGLPLEVYLPAQARWVRSSLNNYRDPLNIQAAVAAALENGREYRIASHG